jgi:glycosyltransferase involved in cell wall biosynthesis
LISVVIPTYNRFPFLKEAITSVLNQTLPPKEIIVVDDGSTDGTKEWMKGRGEVKYYPQENRGPAAARNFGVTQATGSWISFLDSDDLWKERKLETQWDYLQSHPECKICQTEEIWIRKGVRVNPRPVHRKYSGFIFEKCLPLCIISPSSVLMERKLFLELGGFDENYPVCEDYELWLRAALKSPVETLSQPLTVKRGGHSDQLSKKYWGMDRFRVQAMEKILGEGKLNPEQEKRVLEELGKKLTVLALGFSKRYPGKINLYWERWRELQEKYEISFSHAQCGQTAGNSGAA